MKEKYSSYIKWGTTVVCTATVCLLIFFLFFRYKEFVGFLGRLTDVLLPVVIGGVISYLINPIVNFFNKLLTRLCLKLHVSHRIAGNLSTGLSIFISLALVLLLIYTLLSLILPELYQSITKLVANFDGYVDTIQNWFYNLHIFEDNPALYDNLSAMVEKMMANFETFITDQLLGKISNLLSGLTTGLIGVFNTILDVVVGLIVSVYILYSKRKYVGKAKKFTYAFFKPQVANTILHMSSRCNQIFGGFISGKLLDSLIIGMMCFLGLSIFKMPYALLISVIIGVTNIIPFFGPFIGAVPSALLVLLSDPTNIKQVLVFVIFILCLQQFDGNILGPKILGDSTGLSALMVVVSILLGGGFFGFIGMILGVPCFAVIHYLTQCFVHYRLTQKGLPVETISYLDLTSVDTEAGEMHYTISGNKTATGRQATFTRHLRKPEEFRTSSFTESMQAEIKQKEARVSKEQADAEQAAKEKNEAKQNRSKKRPQKHNHPVNK